MRAGVISGCISLCLLLAACASKPEVAVPAPAPLQLQLSPASFAATVSLQQHLTVLRDGATHELDAALEIDPAQVSLVAIALGQRVLTVQYDGKTLQSWRHLMLPAEVQAQNVLQDVQLSFWPLAAVSAALPAGWRITEENNQRTLYQHDVVVSTIRYSATPRWLGRVELNNQRYGYRLSIDSVVNP